MTVAGISTPPVPADVRLAGLEAEKLYEAALGFEQLLVRQLAASLAETAGADGDSSDVATSLAHEQLPDALAEGIASAGGVGLAKTLYETMREAGS